MRLTPLHKCFGAEVHDVDLTRVTSEIGFPEIRAAFERHSLLLFRDQHLDNAEHIKVAGLFGPIEDREDNPENSPVMTNVGPDDKVVPEDDLQIIGLKANMLWHTDSTFMPVPAYAAVLTAQTVPSSGGQTEYASTRASFADMPEDLKERARQAVLRHRYSHSRAQISAELAEQNTFAKWPDQLWRAIWTNPVTGEEAVYVASHACGVEGMDEESGRALIDELIDFITRDEYVYAQRWRPGDVMMWDERALLHRGRPWPYHEERTISSYVMTAGQQEGLDSVRRPAAA